ncbi:MAG: VWA domain-containing protein [Candidatus Binatia bacterium]
MLHFAAPSAWLLAGLLAVLIALHLWDRSRRLVDVPSLLLWQDIATATARATRFVPDWLFALQALTLLLLVAGLAGPFWPSRPSGQANARAALVLDCSASMQAREAQVSRFELARRAVRDHITALQPDDEVVLIAAGPQPVVVVPPTTDHAEALRQLAALEPTDAPANLDAALAAAQRAAARPDRSNRIAVFTDLPAERLSPAWSQHVSVFPVGETDDNLSIDGVQIYQGRFDDPRAARAFVTVRNYASRERHGVLSVALDGTVFGRQGFTLAPRSAAGFPVPALPNPGVLQAWLDVDDALAVDNRASARLRPAHPIHLLAVSDDATFVAELRRIAAAAPNLTLEVIPSAGYDGTRGADLVLAAPPRRCRRARPACTSHRPGPAAPSRRRARPIPPRSARSRSATPRCATSASTCPSTLPTSNSSSRPPGPSPWRARAPTAATCPWSSRANATDIATPHSPSTSPPRACCAPITPTCSSSSSISSTGWCRLPTASASSRPAASRPSMGSPICRAGSSIRAGERPPSRPTRYP